MNAFPARPFGPLDHIDLDVVPLAVVRHEGITIADLRDVFDRGYRAIGSLFADGRLIVAGPAIAVYDGNPMGVFDLELGFPVMTAPAEAVEVGGVTVTASALPSGKATATTTFGPYEGLGAAWRGLLDRTVAEGLTPRGISVEVYVSDPATSTDELHTDLILLVA